MTSTVSYQLQILLGAYSLLNTGFAPKPVALEEEANLGQKSVIQHVKTALLNLPAVETFSTVLWWVATDIKLGSIRIKRTLFCCKTEYWFPTFPLNFLKIYLCPFIFLDNLAYSCNIVDPAYDPFPKPKKERTSVIQNQWRLDREWSVTCHLSLISTKTFRFFFHALTLNKSTKPKGLHTCLSSYFNVNAIVNEFRLCQI